MANAAARLVTLLQGARAASSAPTTKLFIDGKFVDSTTDKWIDVHNPVSVAAGSVAAIAYSQPLFELGECISTGWLTPAQATNELLTRVPQATPAELRRASDNGGRHGRQFELSDFAAAAHAFKTWRESSVLTRQTILLKYQGLLKDNIHEIARNITKEQARRAVHAIT